MELHRDKHHAAYVKGANAALEQLDEARMRSRIRKGAAMRLRTIPPGIVVILNVAAAPQIASSQMISPPGGTTPAGAIFDRLNNATTRGVPQVPPPTVPTPADTVPDRYVQTPGTDGPVYVPGHWERKLSDHEVYTPPLLGRTPNGDTINFPAGVRPPVDERQAP